MKPLLPPLGLLVLAAALAMAPPPLRAQNRATAPLFAPDAAVVALDDIGLYAAGYNFRGQGEEELAPGWSGSFDPKSGVALQSGIEQNGRKAFLLHPPWRGGTGVAFQEFRVQLPALNAARKITLSGATAMRSDALAAPGSEAKSDGATFRILANGRVLLDENRADSKWKPFAFDLSQFAGQTLVLRFETDSGPNNNSAFDFALWGGRELRLEGFTPATTTQLAPPPLDLARLASVQNGEVAPLSGFEGTVSSQVGDDTATLLYSGADGSLQYEWTRPQNANDPPLGSWRLRAKASGATSVDVPLAGDARLEWAKEATFKESRFEKTSGGATCVSTYEVNGQSASVRISAHLSGKSLVLEASCDLPQLASLDAGRFGPVLRRRAVAVPYYSGQVFYLAKENLFAHSFFDWTTSSASSFENTRALYGTRTDGTRALLKERMVFCAAWHFAETLPNIPNPPSPFRAHLGEKTVLDIWGGNFNDIAEKLQTLHDAGLNDCLAIIHNWQRSGYDNALPAHVPANAALGGESGMKNLVLTAKRLGYDIALHENYVDYYPNYEGFDPDDISLDSAGKRVLAWSNSGTKIQSFAVAPSAMLRLARAQSTQIRQRYAPNADYLDVHSGVVPWFHTDFRAGSNGSATMRPTWNAHRDLWAFERANYGGPVLGEGNNHWVWSGLLDGVEAQFGAGWPSNEGQSAPLAVDFDLLKIHPLQLNHGMGYYERWWKDATWNNLPPMAVLDQYRMQEVVYGHAGFLGGEAWSNVPLAWLEHNLLAPVTARTASAKPLRIAYQVNGKWVDGTAAAKSQNWKRVRVEYEGGLTITANDDAAPLIEENTTLPQHGWRASGAGLTAWTALRDGVVADYARTQSSTFANARRARDWNQSGATRILPSVGGFTQTAPRAFSLTYKWKVGQTVPDDFQSFVHFVNADSSIVFQNDHDLPRATSSWKTGETVLDGPHAIQIPATLPDGSYGVRIGLFRAGGERLALQGKNDGTNRISIGTLRVRNDELSFAPETPAAQNGEDIYAQRLNSGEKVVDFGDVRTGGSVLIRREGDEWVLRALPRGGDFSLALQSARFGRPANVRAVDSASSTITTPENGGWWTLKLNGAREYRWK